MSKMAPRCPQEAPKRPQERPKSPQGAPRWPQEVPRWLQVGPKTAPRRPQDDSKPLPSRIQNQLYVSLTSPSPKMSPRSPQNPPRETPDAPKEPLRGPKRPPRGSQEAPRGPQEAFIFSVRMNISCGSGCISHLSYQVACNMSPLGRRRGPALRASIRRRPEGGTTGGSPLCRITLGLIPQSWPLRSIRGPRHSADPVATNLVMAFKSDQNARE